MSGSRSIGQRGFAFFNSSARLQTKKARRRRIEKALRMETLERRELMAVDFAPHHNGIYGADVNRDFELTPLDALIVMNSLNLNGAGELSSDFEPTANSPLLDVNNDGYLTPLDSLTVINALNLGEGVGELVEFKYEFYNTSGVSLDPNPSDNIAEYVASVGQTVILRTSVKDLRSSPDSVFSAYHDIEMKNQDGSTDEIIQLQYGEFDLLRIGQDVRSGNFTVQYGTGSSAQSTAPISPVFTGSGGVDRAATATAIASAIGNLSFVGGVANVRVESLRRLDTADSNFFHFGISFIGSAARKDLPNPSIANTTLANSASAQSAINIRGKSEFDLLQFGSSATGGRFAIQFGSGPTAQTTALISPSFSGATLNKTATAQAIADAVAALGFVGGAANVRVSAQATLDGRDTGNYHFSITFADSVNRAGLGSASVVTSTLVDSASLAVASSMSVRSAIDPSIDSEVFLVGLNFAMNAANGSAQIPRYDQVQDGLLTNQVVGTYTLDEVGATSNQSSSTNIADPGAFFKVFEATFIANRAGTVLLSGNLGEGPPTGGEILLLGENTAIKDPSKVLFPTNIPLRVVRDIQAVNDTLNVQEDSAAITPDVASNDTLIVGTSFGITAVTQPTAGGGTVSFTPGPTVKTVTFTPAANFFGITTFTYTITSNLGASSVGTVTVNVAGINDAPGLITNSFTIAEDPAAPLTITPTSVFNPGPNESTQTVVFSAVNAIANQTNGTVALSGGNVVYTPTADFFGTSLFTVTGTDDGSPAASTTTTITVTVTPVNDAPVPFSGTVSTAEDTALILIGAGAPTNILTSSNPGPLETTQSVSLVSITSPTERGGTITSAGGVSTYTPPANYFGPDTFTYTIADNGSPALQAIGTVTINVTPVNDAPDAVDDSGAARFTAVGLINLATSLDPRRNDSAGPLETTDTIRIVTVGTPSKGGTVTIGPNGQSVLYTPGATLVSTEETFSYTIEDSGGLRDTATATVFVVPPILPFALDDLVIVAEDSGATQIDVLLNDLINNGATKKLLSFTQPASGGTVVLNDGGTPAETSDDKLVFTPNANVFAPLSFTYTMVDTVVGSANSTATVFVNFNEINDSPTAIDRSFGGTEDTVQTISGATMVAGLSKGPLEDSQSLVVSSVSALTTNGGTVAVVNGDVRYTPAVDFVGEFRFTYTVQDNGTTSGAPDPKTATATATITVAPVNDAPVAGADSGTTLEDTSLTIAITTLLANDRPGPVTAVDEVGQTVTFVPFATATIASTAGGTVRVSSDGLSVIYTPKADFNGNDSFSYTVSDGALTSSGTVAVAVTPVNDAPRPTTINQVAYKNLNRSYDISTEVAAIIPGPTDELGQKVRLTRVFANGSTKGTVSLQANGTILYTPATDFTGADSFSYEVSDDGTPNASAVGTINVDVQPFVPSVVSGKIWIDEDRDGKIGEFELLISGATVVLSGRSVGETKDIAPVNYVTLADGSYHFDDLPPGTYTVSYASLANLIDGPDYAGALGDSDPVENQSRITIEAPGGATAQDYNFSLYGIEARYANLLENLASGHYGQFPGIQQKGFYAAVSKTGAPLWSSKKAGFDDTAFGEVVLSDDGTQVFITKINAAHQVLTATVPKNRYVKVADPNGNQLIRILAASSDLTWTQINRATAARKSRHFLSSVDAVFAQENW